MDAASILRFIEVCTQQPYCVLTHERHSTQMNSAGTSHVGHLMTARTEPRPIGDTYSANGDVDSPRLGMVE